MFSLLRHFLRKQRLKQILRNFPDVSKHERQWLIKDLERQNRSMKETLHQISDPAEHERLLARIAAVSAARNILINGSYKSDAQLVRSVRTIYASLIQ